jgi:hypothetical protein
MNQDEKQSNNRTMIFCKFLQNSGIPTSGDVGTLEHAALQWIKNNRINCNNLLASDLNIIRKHGLFNKIFVDQARQNKVEELERQMAQLAHQLKSIKEEVSFAPIEEEVASNPKVSVKNDANKGVSNNSSRFLLAYKANRKKYRMKLLRAISESKNGLSKGEMHIVLGGHASGKILQDCITFLENKNLICMKSVEKRNTKGHRSVVRHWFSINHKLEKNTDGSVSGKDRVIQRQLFDANDKGMESASSGKKPHSPNPACVWAKSFDVFIRKLPETDLIGHAKIKSENNSVKDCGIENYCIYPSGSIKYYLRFRSHDGSFGYSFRRWSTSKDLLEINLKPEFDFGNK